MTKAKLFSWLALLLVSAVYGVFMEWAVGSVWGKIGTSPYIYPNSPLVYSSFIMLPIWGLAGLQGMVIYLAITQRNSRMLLWLLGLAVFTVILVIIFALL